MQFTPGEIIPPALQSRLRFWEAKHLLASSEVTAAKNASSPWKGKSRPSAACLWGKLVPAAKASGRMGCHVGFSLPLLCSSLLELLQLRWVWFWPGPGCSGEWELMARGVQGGEQLAWARCPSPSPARGGSGEHESCQLCSGGQQEQFHAMVLSRSLLLSLAIHFDAM